MTKIKAATKPNNMPNCVRVVVVMLAFAGQLYHGVGANARFANGAKSGCSVIFCYPIVVTQGCRAIMLELCVLNLKGMLTSLMIDDW
jgi:hypothetical protein